MVELKVNDMTRGHCVSAVTQAVRSVDPEASVHAVVPMLASATRTGCCGCSTAR